MSYVGSGGNWFPIQLGQLGLYTDMPSSQIPPNALIKSQNINYVPGFLQKAPGAIRYNTSVLPNGVVAVMDYWINTVTQRLLAATSDGKLWKDNGDRTFMALTPLATGLGTLNNRSQFVIAGNESAGNNKKVFFFSNGISQLKVLSGDGTSFSNVSLPASDWATANSTTNVSSNYPKFGLLHRGRLWAFAKSIAYGSSTTNHEDFQTSNAILVNNVGPGDGGDILGAFVYKGTMLIFKEGDVIYRLIDTDTSSSNWYFTKFGEGLGISSLHGACQLLDDLILGNSSGSLTSLKATQAYGSFTQGDVLKMSKVNQFYRQNLTVAGIPFQQAMYYPDKGIGFFTGKSGYYTYNDSLIQMDVSEPQNPRFGLWNHYQADCLGLRRDINNTQRLIYGARDGYVYLADRETWAVNGNAYTAKFRLPYIDMRQMSPAMATTQKAFEYLSCTFTPSGNFNLNVDVWIDGKLSETVAFKQVVDTNYLNAFILNTSYLGTYEEQTIVVPIRGMGRRISLECYNSNAYETFKVSQLAIGFRPLAEDAQSRLS